MDHEFTTPEGEAVPVIVRASTVDFEEPPAWQRKANYAMSEDRGQALRFALSERISAEQLDWVLAELDAHREVRDGGDVVIRRDFGQFGFLEVSLVEAHGPLASRYLAVSRLPVGERELYIDALIDDALEDRDADVARIHIGAPAATATNDSELGDAPAPAAVHGELTAA